MDVKLELRRFLVNRQILSEKTGNFEMTPLEIRARSQVEALNLADHHKANEDSRVESVFGRAHRKLRRFNPSMPREM